MESIDNRKVIGIDFGGTSVKVGVVQGVEVVETGEAISTQEFRSAEEIIEAMCAPARELIERHGCVAVGCGMPGFVNYQKGLVHTLTNVPGWEAVPLKRILSDKLGVPAAVDNDANAMAYAEWKRGAGRGMSNLVALTMGTGVGGGVVANGQMVRGANFGAGEIGQTSIDWQGRVGAWGNRGALEDYIGNREIAREAVEVYARQGQEKSEADCSPLALSEAAREGDEIARQIWQDVAQKLATSLVNCAYLLNPEAFIIGGGVAQAGDFLFDPLRESLSQQLNPVFFEELQLLSARFGTEAGMIGMAALALDELERGEE